MGQGLLQVRGGARGVLVVQPHQPAQGVEAGEVQPRRFGVHLGEHLLGAVPVRVAHEHGRERQLVHVVRGLRRPRGERQGQQQQEPEPPHQLSSKRRVWVTRTDTGRPA